MDPVIFLAIPFIRFSFLFNPNIFKNTVVKFETVQINVGGGYDNNTGIFTSPSGGYYTFHWSVTSADNSYPCSSAIVKNGKEMIGNANGGNLATLHMNTNDRTWIKATMDCSISWYDSSFSAFKIV